MPRSFTVASASPTKGRKDRKSGGDRIRRCGSLGRGRFGLGINHGRRWRWRGGSAGFLSAGLGRRPFLFDAHAAIGPLIDVTEMIENRVDDVEHERETDELRPRTLLFSVRIMEVSLRAGRQLGNFGEGLPKRHVDFG